MVLVGPQNPYTCGTCRGGCIVSCAPRPSPETPSCIRGWGTSTTGTRGFPVGPPPPPPPPDLVVVGPPPLAPPPVAPPPPPSKVAEKELGKEFGEGAWQSPPGPLLGWGRTPLRLEGHSSPPTSHLPFLAFEIAALCYLVELVWKVRRKSLMNVHFSM